MQKFIIFFLILLQSVCYADFSKTARGEAVFLQKGSDRYWCSVCGMSLKEYYKTNHAVKLKDNTYKQYCSLRCLAFDYNNIKNNISELLVVDAAKEKFINAYTAFYLLGSKIPGTMTKVSKIAFKDKKDAEKFKTQHGGEIVSFKQAFDSAKESLESDTLFLQQKKEKMIYPLGQKIYGSVCKEIDLKGYKKISELKAGIKDKKLCPNLDEQKLHAVALYLWEVKRFEAEKDYKIIATEKEKCPVCGMFVYKYPAWTAEITFKNGTHHVFDGVKDMMKFYFEPQKYDDKVKKDDFEKIRVIDYYTLKAIDGKNAFYVAGSSVYGPMGRELIPFKNLSDAKNFIRDYGGNKILTFGEITREIVHELDK